MPRMLWHGMDTDIFKILGALKLAFVFGLQNGAGNAPGKALVAEFKDNVMKPIIRV